MTHDPFGERLRESLRRMAENVEVAPTSVDELRARATTASARPRWPLLVAAAAAVVIAGIVGIAMASGEDEDSLDTVDTDRTTTTTTEAPSTVTTTTSIEASPQTTAPTTTAPTTTTTTTAPTTTTAAPSARVAPVVVINGDLLGFWNGSSWRSLAGDGTAPLPRPPDVAGRAYTFVSAGGTQHRALLPAPEPVSCREGPYAYRAGEKGEFHRQAGLPEGYDMLAGRTTEITATAEHRQSVQDWKVRRGVPDSPVQIERVLQTDFEGDGRREVIIEATHVPDLEEDRYRGGDYDVVLVRYLDERCQVRVSTVEEIALTRAQADSNNSYFMERYDVLAVVDLNQDGRLEVVTTYQGYEWGGAKVLTLGSDHEFDTVLTSACL